ncbi:MAG: ATP-dependent DNA helicase RecG [Bacteroides sp.]|nr:ATP-dependent DNA helicase RecG [Eubacterium sp.]MCM1418863.1 ATP-dependent DNA helicase RecG [Roseburia sp.]MCM1462910.1 ATP-dependent DNA helicase RecG [Bacteroides sp.]
MKPSDPLTELKGIGEKRAKLFEKLGVFTVGDLIRYYPRDYIDFTAPVPLGELTPEDEPTVFAGVVTKKLRPYIGRQYSIFKAVVSDATDSVLITFFNSEYAFARLVEGREYVFYGKVKGTILAKECNSPLFIDASEENRLVPKYGLTSGLTVRVVSACVKSALTECPTDELLPESIRMRYCLLGAEKAHSYIHFPRSVDELIEARRRLAFEELLVLQLGLKLMKTRTRRSTACVMEEVDLSDFFDALPFTPTNAQYRAIRDCTDDLQRETPMNRLLQGDVGSGKTLVAAALCCFAAKNGYQSALMAPTEILAKQHYDTLCGFLEPLGIKVALLTGSSKKAPVYELLKSGAVDVVIGTQALIQSPVLFNALGLVITDEQHRFGVAQRGSLSEKGIRPHTLVMSATPIPRTLALIIYGDLELSVLNEMPKGRLPIRTYGVDTSYRERLYRFIRKYAERGFQSYIVCPMIEENASEKASATAYFKKLKEDHFPDLPLGLLHGKMKQKEKDAVMRAFKRGEITVLVSTTVIEVGVDVPNAVVIVIENAEQFGLSQLHQLRGRVGRGAEQSHCILVTDSKTDYTRARIETMVRTCNGFEIANEDLRLRGPGDFFGARQHGLPALKIADVASDAALLEETRLLAAEILKKDERLSAPENAGLRTLTERLFRDLPLG